MTRVRRGYTAHRRRTKICLFVLTFKRAHSKLTRTITQPKIRALASSHQERGRKKRNFCRLWITWINVITNTNKVFHSYSRLIHHLYKKKLLLNHMILAQIAISNKNRVYMISNKIIK